MIYLDSAATTKPAPKVVEAMTPYLTWQYGNAGALYPLGRNAANAVLAARKKVSTLFGCKPHQIVFTSGGSEGNSAVFQGLRRSLAQSGRKHIIVSAIEHDSVLNAAKMFAKDGFDITYVKPDTDGCVQPDAIESAIRDDTGLVSVMYVNNETGAVNRIDEVGRICHEHQALFHTDCVQAAGQYPLEVLKNGVDFAVVSAHKIHWPKGVGALFVRRRNLSPWIYGGAEQEFGLRGGTENVPGIVGFGEAACLAVKHMKDDNLTVSIRKRQFYMTLMEELEGCGITERLHINGRPVEKPGKILNLRIDGVDAGTLLLMLAAKGVYVSAGSACRSHESKPSHVLTAMGLSADEAGSSIRVSFSRSNTESEVVYAAKAIAQCVSTLLLVHKNTAGSTDI